MPYIIICAIFILYTIIKDVMHTKERERLILLMRAEKPDIDRLITPPKKDNPHVKKPRRRVFGEVRGDSK